MVNPRERLGLLVKWVRAALTSTEEDSTEEPETETTEALEVNTETEPTMVYWEKDRNQHFIDLFLKKGGLNRIPDTTEEPVKESHYNFDKFFSNRLPEAAQKVQAANIFQFNGVQETPKAGTGISSSGRDASVVAGIVVAVISGILILVGLIAVVVYKHYVHRNVTSMNFDNPVYRKTTEDQFALEKNGYAPGSKLYPSTVGEEAREPLNTPGTNEFV